MASKFRLLDGACDAGHWSLVEAVAGISVKGPRFVPSGQGAAAPKQGLPPSGQQLLAGRAWRWPFGRS